MYFLSLLANLRGTTFNDIVSIRTETDHERIKNFSKGEREIWNEWQSKKQVTNKKATYDDYVKAYGEAMKYL